MLVVSDGGGGGGDDDDDNDGFAIVNSARSYGNVDKHLNARRGDN